ncbi:putative nuclease HARBI1 [Amyelois transitella]|uniref:putative nuclease HARBI1 n=1 Tax=Amyelois transitella TaxID=680683 RepID=UPI0029903FBC|nr:putative nuclease HARBI1 [Amyelois transitella]
MKVFVIDEENFDFDFLVGLDFIKEFSLVQDEKLNICQKIPQQECEIVSKETRKTDIDNKETKSENSVNYNEDIRGEKFAIYINHLDYTKQAVIENLISCNKSVFAKDKYDIGKILIALSFYATGSYQTPVGDSKFHPASQASVSKVLEEVTVALNRPEIFHKYVKFPLSRHEREKVKRKFYRSTRLPGVLGCVDGTHVAIVTPHEHEERYFNRKGYHSLNVLIVSTFNKAYLCDADLMIMNVDPSYPGATHDSKIWENHPLKGDSGYPLRATLMTPIENALPGSPEAHYTSLHVCLLADRRLHYSPEKAARITNACCVLHNIAHAGGIEYEPLTEEEARRERQLTEGASPRAPPAPEDPASVARAVRAGRERRHRLVNQLWRQRHTTLSRK